MRKTIIFGLACAVMLMLFGAGEITDKFQINYWNNYYWLKARLPDGTTVELKDPNDLTYTQWKAKLIKYWQNSQNPPEPNYPVLFDNAVYSVLEKDVNDLILYWKPDEQKIEITPPKLKFLQAATVQMKGEFNP